MTLPKLHIRDLFWLVLVAALGCSWWVERLSTYERQQEMEAIRTALDDFGLYLSDESGKMQVEVNNGCGTPLDE